MPSDDFFDEMQKFFDEFDRELGEMDAQSAELHRDNPAVAKDMLDTEKGIRTFMHQFVEIPAKRRERKRQLAAIGELLTELGQQKKLIESKTFLEVSEETTKEDKAGETVVKPRYTNEKQREAEVQARLRSNQRYLSLLNREHKANERKNLADIENSYFNDLYRTGEIISSLASSSGGFRFKGD